MHNKSQCGIAKTLEIIGGKWTVLIIRDLLGDPKRYSELEHSLSGISPRTLSARLKELEAEDIIQRDCENHPAHPMYSLTEKGRSLSAILAQMREWGQAHLDTNITYNQAPRAYSSQMIGSLEN